MGLTGSSHYITIPDFIKICTYFKHPPPDDIMNFTVVTSVVPTSDVLLIFNNPTAESSVKLLSQLSEESKLRSSQENSANTGGSSGGANRSDHQGATGSEGGSRSKSGSKGGEVDESYINSGESKSLGWALGRRGEGGGAGREKEREEHEREKYGSGGGGGGTELEREKLGGIVLLLKIFLQYYY